jgi:hypothetical protein
LLERRIDFVHFLEFVVRNIRLGKKDVHVAWHPARHGVDGKLDLGAAFFEKAGKIAHCVLRLRHGHAVSGHDDDAARIGQNHRNFLGIRGFYGL